MTKCELCGSEVKVVGKTTLHYEPISELPRLDEAEVKGRIRSIRMGEDADDPFIRYQDGQMSKGALLDVITKEICSKFSPKVVREEPLLGLATTRELLDEIRARVDVDGKLEYRTVDA